MTAAVVVEELERSTAGARNDRKRMSVSVCGCVIIIIIIIYRGYVLFPGRMAGALG
jgi:t-SNARE complex subunit (syntaxin)